MCIICNLRDGHNDAPVAYEFLGAYRASQIAMAKAVDAMLAVTKLDLEPADRVKYDRTHKQMCRIMREWNKVEHARELAPDAS